MRAGGGGLAHALAHGYQPAMLALAGGAWPRPVTAVFVSDERVAAPRIARPAPHHGRAPPAPDLQES